MNRTGPSPTTEPQGYKGSHHFYFFFLFTFNSTDTAEVWNTDVRPGVCDRLVCTDRLSLSSHLHPLAVVPKCLVSLSCMNSATRPVCQVREWENSVDSKVKGRSWSCSASVWVFAHKSCTPGVGREQAQVPPRSSNQPLAPGKVTEKTLNIQKRPISLVSSTWAAEGVTGGKWPIGVSRGWTAGEFC